MLCTQACQHLLLLLRADVRGVADVGDRLHACVLGLLLLLPPLLTLLTTVLLLAAVQRLLLLLLVALKLILADAADMLPLRGCSAPGALTTGPSTVHR